MAAVNNNGIPQELLAQLQADFDANGQLRLAELSTQRHKLFDLVINRQLADSISSTSAFEHSVPEVKPVTDQRRSGRCWIFAALNMIRVPLAERLGVTELELSQSHLLFWDKLERGYYLLQCFHQCAERGEPLDGRLWQHLLHNPAEDGGQWDMFVNLIEKHGLMPKQCWTEPQPTQETLQFNFLLNTWYRESAKQIRDRHLAGESQQAIRQFIDQTLLKQLFSICRVAFGSPPQTITFEYTSTSRSANAATAASASSEGSTKKYQRIGPITPIEFYQQHVRPIIDVSQQVCLINDPRNEYYRLYTVDMLNNMASARSVLYINLPSERLRELTRVTLSDRRPVWFGSHVSKGHSRTAGIADPSIIRTDLLFGFQIQQMNKSERLQYGDSLMTHAMLITGVTEDTKPGKWRVENSWGQDYGNKGYLTITDDWFDNFVYEVAIERGRLNERELAVLSQKPVLLPAWDPMGALAK